VGTQACAFIIHLALVFLLILCLKFETLCGFVATAVCMRLCFMGYMCHVDPYVYSLMFVSTWYMCEMAMKLLSGISLLSYSEFHNV
jgi:hypothetical protein